MKYKKYIGKTFGTLKVVKYTSNGTLLCICNECGKESVISKSKLNNFPTCRNCQPYATRNKKYIGNKYGKLTVLKSVDDKNLLCKCDCGNECIVSIQKLNTSKYLMCNKCKQKDLFTRKTNQKIIDLTGKRFGKLVVIKRMGTDNQHQRLWLCQCDCGNQTITRGYLLRHGRTRSCGCYGKEKRTPVQDSYFREVFNRLNRNNKLCDEWKDNVLEFYIWALQNGYDINNSKHLRLKDESKLYSPENCYFSNEIKGRPLIDSPYGKVTITELSRLSGVSRASIKLRYINGYTNEDLLKKHYNCKKIDTDEYGTIGIKELSKITGYSYEVMRAKVKLGKTNEELLQKNPYPNRLNPIKIKTKYGKLTFKELSEITGVQVDTLRARYLRQGNIDTPTKKSRIKININGKKLSLCSFCRQYHISDLTVLRKLKMGMTIEEILNQVQPKKHRTPIQVYDLNNKLLFTCKSAKEVSKLIGIGETTVYNYLKGITDKPQYILKRIEENKNEK